MCKICKKVKNMEPSEAFTLITEEILNGRDPEHFKEILDDLLETKEPVQDAELDEAWENGRGRK